MGKENKGNHMDEKKPDPIDEESCCQKDTYSDEEKKITMSKIDEVRRADQEAMKALEAKKTQYTQSEKEKILNKLNEQRLSKQKREEIAKRRTENKEIYKFGNKTFYKFLRMEREYFIEISDCNKLGARPSIITLYYCALEEFKKKDVLIKTEIYSDKFFISYDAIRVYYKSYALEDERKK